MAAVGSFLLLCVVCVVPTSECSLVRVPETRGAAGVFMLIDGGRYTLNFTAATAACRFLNVTIATRAQLERALHGGLETCKFGWIHERFAAIPRLKPDRNCGSGKTGLVPWFAREDRLFAVYCFDASDLEETSETSTTHPPTSAFASTMPARTRAPTIPAQTRVPTIPAQTRAPTIPAQTRALTMPAQTRALTSTVAPSTWTSTRPTPAAGKTSVTSALAPLAETTRSAGPASPAPPLEPSPTRVPTPARLIPSDPGDVTSTVHDPNLSVSSEPPVPRAADPTPRSLAAVLSGLGVALLLVAAAAPLYHKRKSFRLSQDEQRDNAETEMWKHTDSEMNLHSRPGTDEEEEEEEDFERLFSGDFQLCVNASTKTNPSNQA